MEIKYLGHSAFEFLVNNKTILIDPFLIMVPQYKPNNLTNIFVTHGHGDHIGDAINLSKGNNAPITAIFELANYCAKKGANTSGVGLGSWINYSFGKAIFLPAFHSSSSPEGIYTGNPAGILFEIENKRIFHAGDTCLNSEMKVLKEVYKPDIAILPIGGTYTMDVESATIAAEWIGAKTIIPMHYNTFPQIKANPVELKNNLESKNIHVEIMGINQIINL